jgi:hypothetical protein
MVTERVETSTETTEQVPVLCPATAGWKTSHTAPSIPTQYPGAQVSSVKMKTSLDGAPLSFDVALCHRLRERLVVDAALQNELARVDKSL